MGKHNHSMLIDPATWRELFEAVHEINLAKSHADFATSVVTGMRKLIVADVTVFQVLDRKRARIITQMHPPEPFTPEEVAYYIAHPQDFPLVAHYDRTQVMEAKRISDVVDEAEWLASDYYHTCLARQELRYGLALPIAVNESTVAALSFNRRAADFTLHDCELLNAFAPHFRLAWERQENPWMELRQSNALKRLQELGLKPRESEVLFWMVEGKQNREIAQILGLQLGTVQEYVAAILTRLRQENRHAATVFALKKLREP